MSQSSSLHPDAKARMDMFLRCCPNARAGQKINATPSGHSQYEHAWRPQNAATTSQLPGESSPAESDL